jgi:predicted CoA-binding protein|tara:strand:+ start:122 stop:601 length:480 start_codon:yes stop_codon:yes gene_type:complete
LQLIADHHYQIKLSKVIKMTDTTLTEWQDPDVIRSALSKKRIAVVGMSSKEHRASYLVGNYLKQKGYVVIPVNPREPEILGLKCYPGLLDIPDPVDVVNVFRVSAAVPQIAEESVKIGAKYLWLQLGVISAQGVSIASQGGLQCIVDRCLKIEHVRYMV